MENWKNNTSSWVLSLGKRRRKTGVIVEKTIVSVDLKGVSSMRLRLPKEQVDKRIDAFRDLITNTCIDNQNAHVDYFDLPDGTKDDSISITFDASHVTEAVNLALKMQESLENASDELSTYGKIGIATGSIADVENNEGGSDLMGILYYYSASIGKLANGGSVMIDENTHKLCNWDAVKTGYIGNKLTAHNVPRIQNDLDCYEISYSDKSHGLQSRYEG